MQEYCIKIYPDYHNSKIILITSKIRKTLKNVRKIRLHKQKILTAVIGKSATKRNTYTLYVLSRNHAAHNKIDFKKVDLRISEILV